MTSEASHQPEGTRPAPGRLYAILKILDLPLGVLAAGMLFVWLFAEVGAVGQRTPNPWAAFAWAATWGLFAAWGLCGFLVPGLILSVRPTRIALVAPTLAASLRRWPRLAGLTFVWAGVWLIAIAVFLLTQVDDIARTSVPQFSDTTVAVTFAVMILPAYSVMLAGRLVPLARR